MPPASEKTANQNQNNNTPLSQLSQEQATKSNAIEIPQITLPKGGGALKGIDEKFQVNAVNGTSSFSIPLPLSPNRNGFIPQLSLSYNSGVGNGLFGIGWDIDLPAIQRRTDKKLPRYFDSNNTEGVAKEDSFMFSGVEELVPYMDYNESRKTWAVRQFEDVTQQFIIRAYRPRIEGGFSRIERIYQKRTSSYYWRVTSKENITTFFGYTEGCRIYDTSDPNDKSKVFQWLPEFSFDDKGSWVWYEYKAENLRGVEEDVHEQNRFNRNALFTNKHIKRIKYGNKDAYYFDKEKGNAANPYEINVPQNVAHFFELVFDYGEHGTIDNPTFTETTTWKARNDAFSSYRSCFEMRTYRLCKRVLMFHTFPNEADGKERLNNGEPTLVRSINFEYKYSSIYKKESLLTEEEKRKNAELTYLIAIEQIGYVKVGATYSHKSLPKMTFEYQELTWNKDIQTVSSENLVHAPVGLSGNYQWTDLYNEGINGILTEQANGWFYKSNLGQDTEGGVHFSHAQSVMPKPSFTGLSNGTLQLQDLDANGEKQLVVNTEGVHGYFELDDEGTWQPFKSFLKKLNLDLRDPNVRMLDVNGDGKPEVVLSDLGAFWFWENQGKIGYDAPELAVKPYDEERGASIVFSDQEQRIFLADMSGDGLTDIVRIRNGEVCYWANMGYGRFSAKVTMGNSPIFDHPDMFNPSYIQLADISGTGATDIIYLGNCHAGGINAYLNCCGNRWTDAEAIDPFFPTEQPNKITVTDLLGNGTACIVWSSEMPAYQTAPMRYIDLMGGKKPHIMQSHQNGFGKKTEVEYKSSTYFYLKDKLDCTPWITKLAFPVQLVTKTIVTDSVTNVRFTAQYSYHHGYYDHAEREFRGFGRVDQTDTEDYEDWIQSTASNGQQGAEHHEPPVLTRTWFHTGAFITQDRILKQYEKEYWYNAANKSALKDDTLKDAYLDLPINMPSLNADEEREAVRACKGMALRQEVFALDAKKRIADEKKAKNYPDNDPEFIRFQTKARETEQTPYSVATHTCFIRPLQPRKDNKNAVFIVLESEAMTFSYERNPEDARVAHTMNLDIDQYAHVTKAVSIVYGRNTGKKSLLPNYGFVNSFQGFHQSILEVEQHKTHVILTETDFTYDDLTNDIAFYRLPLPYQVKTFECQGDILKDGDYFTIEEVKKWLNKQKDVQGKVIELPYETPNTTTGKRLIEHIQTRYLKNDLSGALDIKKLESLALPFEAYQLAFTPEILRGLYGSKLTDVQNTLVNKGKYEQVDNTNYWISSGKPIFLKQDRNEAAVKAEFYLPIGYEDPFEIKTWVTFGTHLMYIKSATDAMGNQTLVEDFDFRTLSPKKLKDINGNFSAVETDALGMVVATAVYSKNGEGDTLVGGDWLFTQDRINRFFANPHNEAANLLQSATACLIYDLDRNDNQPTRVATIARETHFKTFENGVLTTNTTPPQYQISIEYSDGLGNVALKKVQAEPESAGQPLRWIGNGRTVLNNKGKPIKQYEPYFSPTQHYESETDFSRNQGVTPVLYYDAVGRNIKTELPDHTFIKVEFDAWEQRSFDQNDTVGTRKTDGTLENTSVWYNERITGQLGRNEQLAAQKAEVHADTPSIIYLDSLGRPFFSIAHNKGIVRGDTTRLDQPFEEYYPTYVTLDIEGNVHEVKDARNNTVMAYKYDMLGHRLYQLGMDNGERWMFNDCMGKPIFAWDSRNQLFRTRYDDLHRPIEILKTDYTPTTNPLTVGNWHKLEIMVYGTNGLNNTADDTVTNRNGALKTHFDTTGILVLDRNDFKGNPLETTRQYCQNPTMMPNWSQNVPMETEIWQSSSRYDALNRPIAQIAPHLLGTTLTNIVLHEFDKSGLLKKVSAILRGGNVPTPFVTNIAYNQKGQRILIDYGNNTGTRYEYDRATYRLTRLLTVNTNGNSRDSGKFYQDLNYTYDPVGNITHIRDDAQQTFYFSNQVVDPSCAYEYDALYRLIRAEGREHIGQLANDQYNNWNDAPKMNHPNPNDGNAMRRYTQQYDYDAVGNFTEMRHIANGGSWTRHYTTDNNSNRLIKSWVGNNANLTRVFTYDAHGSMTTMPHLKTIDWNCKDQLERAARVDATLPSDEQGDTYHFQYDAAGQRSRKLTAHNGDKKKERLYMGGFEIYREYTGSNVSLARETLHIMDDTQRIAMVETRTVGNDGTEGVLIRYQYGNHLGSASLEMEGSDTPRIISYEEYHPYGTTAYQAKNATIQCAAKRYRYTGMERDEETGLAYHSARYYLPWLGRWGSCDPIGVGDGVNVYLYTQSNPIELKDSNGLACQETGLPNGWHCQTYTIFGPKGERTSVNFPEKDSDPSRDVSDLGRDGRLFYEGTMWKEGSTKTSNQDEKDITFSDPPLVQADVDPPPPPPKKLTQKAQVTKVVALVAPLGLSDQTLDIERLKRKEKALKDIDNVNNTKEDSLIVSYFKNDFGPTTRKESLPLISKWFGRAAKVMKYIPPLKKVAKIYEGIAIAADGVMIVYDLAHVSQGEAFEQGSKEVIKRTKPIKRMAKEIIKKAFPSLPDPMIDKIAGELEETFEKQIADPQLKKLREEMENSDQEGDLKKSLNEIFKEWLKKNLIF